MKGPAISSEDLTLEVHVASPGTFQEEIDAAVTAAQAVAIEQGRGGILLTRHSYTHFTVEISEEVPFGVIQERQTWDEPDGPAA